MKRLVFEHAWHAGRFARDLVVEIDERGLIVAAHEASGTASGGERVAGIAIPGFINVHSHAFQRGMAGLSEYRSATRDDFWTWRELMYHFLRWLSPDDCYVLARQLYVEMLQAGYTTVGEFHYLHNDPSGREYSNRAAMLEPLLAAAEEVGIRLVVLPTLYQRGGFGRELSEAQRRFAISTDHCLDLVRTVRERARRQPTVHAGFALHSLRAVEMSVAQEAVAELRQSFGDLPIHMHAAEQRREVDECFKHHRRRPVEWTLEELGAGERWCLIHATHINAQEETRLAASQTVAGLCPTTEANLGDGIFPSAEFLRRGGQVAIGSDSHIGIDPRGELRLIEYAQRLTQERRVVVGDEAQSCGTVLCEATWRGGARALGLPVGKLEVGSCADFVVLDAADPVLAGLPAERWLDGLVFCQIGNPIRDVMVHGRWVVRNRRHPLAEQSQQPFATTVRAILSRQ